MNAPLALSSTSPLGAFEPLPQRWVGKLFEQLSGQLGAKLADLYAGIKPETVQGEWAKGLAGFAPDEIRRGLAECSSKTRGFAPNLGEFKLLCRPALDPEYAWQEAQDGLQARDRGEVGQWSHPAVWRAACAMPYELRNSTYRAARVRWGRVLSKEFEKGWGDPAPPVPECVEHRPTLTSMPAAVRDKLASMGINFNRRSAV
jgi:hypothetical protein